MRMSIKEIGFKVNVVHWSRVIKDVSILKGAINRKKPKADHAAHVVTYAKLFSIGCFSRADNYPKVENSQPR